MTGLTPIIDTAKVSVLKAPTKKQTVDCGEANKTFLTALKDYFSPDISKGSPNTVKETYRIVKTVCSGKVVAGEYVDGTNVADLNSLFGSDLVGYLDKHCKAIPTELNPTQNEQTVAEMKGRYNGCIHLDLDIKKAVETYYVGAFSEQFRTWDSHSFRFTPWNAQAIENLLQHCKWFYGPKSKNLQEFLKQALLHKEVKGGLWECYSITEDAKFEACKANAIQNLNILPTDIILTQDVIREILEAHAVKFINKVIGALPGDVVPNPDQIQKDELLGWKRLAERTNLGTPIQFKESELTCWKDAAVEWNNTFLPPNNGTLEFFFRLLSKLIFKWERDFHPTTLSILKYLEVSEFECLRGTKDFRNQLYSIIRHKENAQYLKDGLTKLVSIYVLYWKEHYDKWVTRVGEEKNLDVKFRTSFVNASEDALKAYSEHITTKAPVPIKDKIDDFDAILKKYPA